MFVSEDFFLSFFKEKDIKILNGEVMIEERRLSVMDFLVNVLKDHEKNLDALEDKLENVVNTLKDVEKPAEAKFNSSLVISCNRWNEFKEACVGCDTVVFGVGDALTVYGLNGSRVAAYSEAFPSSLACGLKIKVKAEPDKNEVKEWLSIELDIDETRIFVGDVYEKRNGNSVTSLLK